LRKIVRLSVGIEGENHDDALVKKKTTNYRLQVTRRQRYSNKKREVQNACSSSSLVGPFLSLRHRGAYKLDY
jgi:hypothetical protein